LRKGSLANPLVFRAFQIHHLPTLQVIMMICRSVNVIQYTMLLVQIRIRAHDFIQQ
jgi:hypothetical protein